MDKSGLQQQIADVFESFITLLSPLSSEIINASPKQGSWTIGQLAQHVILATSGVPDTKSKPAGRPYDQLEPSIKGTFLNYELKMQSPEFIAPEKRKYEREELLTALKKNKLELADIIKEKDLTELCLDMELPNWGYLTRFEWIKLITYHVERHTQQLKKLKNDFVLFF